MLYGFADDAGLSVLASDSNEVVFRSELLNLQLLHGDPIRILSPLPDMSFQFFYFLHIFPLYLLHQREVNDNI